MTITKQSFGRFANDVEDFGGELTLPVGQRYEIHPAAEEGRWAVVNHTTGQVATTCDEIDDAVAYAEQADSEENDA